MYDDTKEIYTPAEFAKVTGINDTKKLQYLDKTGVLVAHRTETNRRFYTKDQLLSVLNSRKSDDPNYSCAVYIRVPNSYTREAEENIRKCQLVVIKKFLASHGLSIQNIYSDYNSGLSFEREGFSKLQEDIRSGKVKNIIFMNSSVYIRPKVIYDFYLSTMKDLYHINVYDLDNYDIHNEFKEYLADLDYGLSDKFDMCYSEEEKEMNDINDYRRQQEETNW